MESTPVQIPDAVPPPLPPPPPTYRLFRISAITLATFLGSPLAGCGVLAINFHRLGRPAAAWRSLALGALASAALVWLALILPEKAPGTAFVIVQVLVMYTLAGRLQGEAVSRHAALGGRMASNWSAAGIGLAGLVIVGGAILGGFFLLESTRLGNRVEFSNGNEIYYSGQATENDARALAKGLEEVGYFVPGNPKSVTLSKGADGTVVGFVVVKDAWDKAEVIDAFRKIAAGLAPTVARPLSVRLLNDDLETKREIKAP